MRCRYIFPLKILLAICRRHFRRNDADSVMVALAASTAVVADLSGDVYDGLSPHPLTPPP